MAKTITQKVVFKNTTVKALYELYMDAKKHAIVTGKKTKIKKKEGTKFSAYGNDIKGRNLQLVENEMIVQSWRESTWSKSTQDSILVLIFEQKGREVELNLTQANVPTKYADSIALGWEDYYWKGWRTYLTAKAADKITAKSENEKSDENSTALKATVKKVPVKVVAKAVKKAVKKAAKKSAKK